MIEINLMASFSSMMTSFQLKPPLSFPLHPLQSCPAAVSSLLSLTGLDERNQVSMALSARRGKLIRDKINRAAPEEPGINLPLLEGLSWLGRGT